MFLVIMVIFGFCIAANAILSARSGEQALKFTTFILATDFGISGLLHNSPPPDQQFFSLISDFFLLMIWVQNRRLYSSHKKLGSAVGLSYLTMIGMLAMVLVTRGEFAPIREYVSTALFALLLLLNGGVGLRDAFSDMGHRSRSGRWGILHSHHNSGHRP